MKRTMLILLVLGILGFGLWGCTLSTTSTPATPTATIPASPASTPTLTSTLLSLVTATVTHTLQLTTTDALNIRAGPGLHYPVLGVFAAGAGAEIIGRAADGAWWRVTCPPGLAGDECWVINDETILSVIGFGEAPVLPAPPVPPTATPIPTSTPTPCIVAAPAGWVGRPVRGGDTLFAIAQYTGATVEQLRTVNCLLSDTIIAGDTLFAPGSGVLPVVIATPQSVATPLPLPAAGVAAVLQHEAPTALPLPAAGVAAVLQHANPGAEGCPKPLAGATPHIFIVGATEAPVKEKRQWELGEKFIICALNFAAATPVTPVIIQVVRPDASEQTRNFDPRRRAQWTWMTLPEDPLGTYTVTATQGITSVTAVFTVSLPSQPHLLALVEKAVTPGETIPFVVAGLRPGQPLYLYHLQPPNNKEWTLIRELSPAPGGAGRATNYKVLTTPSDPPGRYLVHTGELIKIHTEKGANMFILQ